MIRNRGYLQRAMAHQPTLSVDWLKAHDCVAYHGMRGLTDKLDYVRGGSLGLYVGEISAASRPTPIPFHQNGLALGFSGSQNLFYANVDALTALQQGTFACWFYTTTASPAVQDFAAYTTAATSPPVSTGWGALSFGLRTSITPGNALRLDCTFVNNYALPGSVIDGIHGSTTITLNTWHHLVVSCTGSSTTMYLNGVAESLTAWGGGNNGNWFADVGPNAPEAFRVGNVLIATEGGEVSYLSGGMCEHLYLSRALSAAEVSELYSQYFSRKRLRRYPSKKLAIQFDAGSGSTYQTTATGTGLSWSHTCAGSDRYLVVGVSIFTPSVTVSALDYNGDAMTYLGDTTGGGNRVEIWGLIAPDTGTHNVNLTLSGAADYVGAASSWNNVNQITATEGMTGNGGIEFGTGSASVDVTTAADGDFVVDMVIVGGDSTISVGSGQTSVHNSGGASGAGAMSYEGPKSPAGSVFMSWDNITAANWLTVAIALRPTTAASGSTYNETGSGGVIVGGTGTIQKTSTLTGSGGAIVGGTGSVQETFTLTDSGTLTLGGSGSPIRNQSATGSGTLTIAGAGVVQATYTFAGSGGVVLAGAGDNAVVNNTVEGEGGVTIGGAGSVQANYTLADSGGLTIAGSGVPQLQASLTDSGGVVIAGSGVVQLTANIAGIGGVVLAGTGSNAVINDDVQGEGGVTIGGVGLVQLAIVLFGTGSLTVGGTGQVLKTLPIVGSGGVNVGGVGSILATHNVIGSGGVLLGGSGLAVLVVVTIPPAIEYRFLCGSFLQYGFIAEPIDSYFTCELILDSFIQKEIIMQAIIGIGSDFFMQANDVRRGGYNKTFLLAADVAWELTEDDGTTIVASGTLPYVPGTRATYEGIIGKSVTIGLTEGNFYRLRITVEEGVNGDTGVRRLQAKTEEI